MSLITSTRIYQKPVFSTQRLESLLWVVLIFTLTLEDHLRGKFKLISKFLSLKCFILSLCTGSEFKYLKEIGSCLPFRCQRGQQGRAFHTVSARSPRFLAWCLSERCCDFGNCAHSCLKDKTRRNKSFDLIVFFSPMQLNKNWTEI